MALSGCGSGGAAVDTRQVDAGLDVDAADGGLTLVAELFGPQDPSLPGKACAAQTDKCRGASRLFVCMNDQGKIAGPGTTCRACTSDAQCALEYSYYVPQGVDVRCGADGTCHPIGTDGKEHSGDYCEGAGLGWCATSQLGWFVCGADQHCARCTSTKQCSDAFGCSWVCQATASGACGDVQPPPPGCQ